jgi:hypothetical protein
LIALRVTDWGLKEAIETTLPYSAFGDWDCCGCLNGIICGEQATIVCNECDAVIRTVPTADLEQTLTDMEFTLEVASEMCPHCGSVNLFPGFSSMLAFTCRECGICDGSESGRDPQQPARHSLGRSSVVVDFDPDGLWLWRLPSWPA